MCPYCGSGDIEFEGIIEEEDGETLDVWTCRECGCEIHVSYSDPEQESE